MTIRSISRITKRITSQLTIVTGVARSSSTVMISILTSQTVVFTISTRRVVELQADVTRADTVELASARGHEEWSCRFFSECLKIATTVPTLATASPAGGLARTEPEGLREGRSRSV